MSKSTFSITKRQVGLTLLTGAVLICGIAFWLWLPLPLFNKPTSVVLESRDGRMMEAAIAQDEQWRFPAMDTVPERVEQAILTFEDQRFYYHPGIDPLAIGRACIQNMQEGEVVSGGSTITMQIARLSYNNPPRTVWQKLMETLLAVRLEFAYSKEELLARYASHAPFGGNVVGVPAAAWRYFGKKPSQLSWGEAATLAVLPNQPGLIYPGRNRDALEQKRNQLLEQLVDDGRINSTTCQLAQKEPLPDQPHPLPQHAPHLLSFARADYLQEDKNASKSRLRTTIDLDLQQKVNRIVHQHNQRLQGNGILNASALVLDVKTGAVRAYTGNVYRPDQPKFDSHVDVIQRKRSTGSVLKPLLFAGLLSDGLLLPNALVADVPTRISGFAPQNYSKTFDGAVPASRALARSLNVPAVRMLQDYGLERFHHLLQELGMSTINRPPSHYGLSLIIGGGEGTLWDICGIYASMARSLNRYNERMARYHPSDYRKPYVLSERRQPKRQIPDDDLRYEPAFFSAGALYSTFEAMATVKRPEDDLNWELFSSSQKIAWKTGTSYGYRDGWAIGCTPRYVVGVWTGNADGEGRPGLTGKTAAAPILFDIFDELEQSRWFNKPHDDQVKLEVCRESGYKASRICPEVDTVLMPDGTETTDQCPFHRYVHIDTTVDRQAHLDCAQPLHLVRKPWFVLPPVMAWYYKERSTEYRSLPPFKAGCEESGQQHPMEFVYPPKKAGLYVPVELDGQQGKAVFEVAHNRPSATIYWHLDDDYLGTTTDYHQMALSPAPGKHTLTLVDGKGHELEQEVKVLGE